MRILLFGKRGQAARCIRDAARDVDLISLGSADCDLSKPGAGANAIAGHKPDVVINAAAYTAVDKAETERTLAERLNAKAPGELAAAAARTNARLIHLSTDYVFDGQADTAYDELSATNPVNWYGATKLAGETTVLAAAPDAIVLRTSWVFSEYGANFVKTMLRLGREKPVLDIVGDQFGGPTPAAEIAKTVLRIAAKLQRGAGGRGVYHFQGRPSASWADFAKSIFQYAGLETRVREIATAEFPTAAARPARTILDCARIERDFGVAPPDWRSEARRVVAALETGPGTP